MDIDLYNQFHHDLSMLEIKWRSHTTTRRGWWRRWLRCLIWCRCGCGWSPPHHHHSHGRWWWWWWCITRRSHLPMNTIPVFIIDPLTRIIPIVQHLCVIVIVHVELVVGCGCARGEFMTSHAIITTRAVVSNVVIRHHDQLGGRWHWWWCCHHHWCLWCELQQVFIGCCCCCWCWCGIPLDDTGKGGSHGLVNHFCMYSVSCFLQVSYGYGVSGNYSYKFNDRWIVVLYCMVYRTGWLELYVCLWYRAFVYIVQGSGR